MNDLSKHTAPWAGVVWNSYYVTTGGLTADGYNRTRVVYTSCFFNFGDSGAGSDNAFFLCDVGLNKPLLRYITFLITKITIILDMGNWNALRKFAARITEHYSLIN